MFARTRYARNVQDFSGITSARNPSTPSTVRGNRTSLTAISIGTPFSARAITSPAIYRFFIRRAGETINVSTTDTLGATRRGHVNNSRRRAAAVQCLRCIYEALVSVNNKSHGDVFRGALWRPRVLFYRRLLATAEGKYCFNALLFLRPLGLIES